MTERCRILLDGYPVAAEREGDALVAGDGRWVAVESAVHLPPVMPTRIDDRVADIARTAPQR